jgi:hypothetical protein
MKKILIAIAILLGVSFLTWALPQPTPPTPPTPTVTITGLTVDDVNYVLDLIDNSALPGPVRKPLYAKFLSQAQRQLDSMNKKPVIKKP